MKLQTRMIIIVTVFGLAVIILTNIALYQFMKAKDHQQILKNARNTSRLIKTGLLNTMIQSGDYGEINDVIKDMQNDLDFEFRMIRSKHVIKQHGVRRGEVPKDSLEKKALETGEVIESLDDESTLRIIYPFITDNRCGECHLGMDDKPVPVGVVNGAAVIRFDLSEQQRETTSIIRSVLAGMTGVGILFLAAFLVTINNAVTTPIRRIAHSFTKIQNEEYDIYLPKCNTVEIEIVASEVRKTAKLLEERMKERDLELEKEKNRSKEMESFVKSRAAALGLKTDMDVRDIIGRLSHAVDEAQKSKLLSLAFEYVDHKNSRMIIPSNPGLIPVVSAYFSSLVESNLTEAKRSTLELVLDEALANSIFHGNLEVSSEMKINDFDGFYELASQRQNEDQFKSRKVLIDYEYDQRRLKIIITDEGKGFDWRKWVAVTPEDFELPHGRGIKIMRAFASNLQFNEMGNQIILEFDFEKSNSKV